MKITKQLLAMALSIIMLCSLAPATVFAAAVNLDDLLGEWKGVGHLAISGAEANPEASVRIYKENGQYKWHDEKDYPGGQKLITVWTLTARPDGTINVSDGVIVNDPSGRANLVNAVLTFDGTFLVTERGNRYERISASSVSVGDTIQFGGYGWRVLDVKDGKALLLSDKVLERKAIHHDGKVIITWADSDMRQYLNGEFLGGIPADERAKIAETTVANKDNQWYGTKGGNDTKDKIFLLSLDEVVKYFGDSGKAAAKAMISTTITPAATCKRTARRQAIRRPHNRTKHPVIRRTPAIPVLKRILRLRKILMVYYL